MTHYKAPVLQICTCIWGSNLHLMQANFVLHNVLLCCRNLCMTEYQETCNKLSSNYNEKSLLNSIEVWTKLLFLVKVVCPLPNPENVQEAQFCRWLATEFFVWIWEFIWQSEMMTTFWSYIMILFCVNVHLILLDLIFKSRNSRCRIQVWWFN